jgi:uncharacterized protein YutE (UPF0331/DUF86 family)
MTANELAEGILAIEERIFLTKKEHQLFQNSATMLRQQQAEIEALKERLEETRQLYIKELALQRLSDIGQMIEDKESAIYATGYWKGIEYKRIRELTDEEILKLTCEHGLDGELMIFNNFARAILKKAIEK